MTEIKYKTGGQSTIIKKFEITDAESAHQLAREMEADEQEYGWAKIIEEYKPPTDGAP